MTHHYKTNWLVIAIWAILFLVAHDGSPVYAQSQAEKNVSFRWALVALVGDDVDKELISISRSAVLQTGDKVKIFIEPRQTSVYLIYRNESNEIEWLFPNNLESYKIENGGTQKYLIPMADQWFELDQNTGTETLYLIASARPLPELEALLKDHGRSVGTEQKRIGDHLLDKIRDLNMAYRTRPDAAAERPTSIGGSVRGHPKHDQNLHIDLELMAQEISARKIYCRTFTIDHR